jgi:hypothetical protein
MQGGRGLTVSLLHTLGLAVAIRLQGCAQSH